MNAKNAEPGTGIPNPGYGGCRSLLVDVASQPYISDMIKIMKRNLRATSIRAASIAGHFRNLVLLCCNVSDAVNRYCLYRRAEGKPLKTRKSIISSYGRIMKTEYCPPLSTGDFHTCQTADRSKCMVCAGTVVPRSKKRLQCSRLAHS